MEKLLVIWIRDQTSHNVPWSQNLIQSQDLNFSILRMPEEVRKMYKSLKPTAVGSWGLKEKVKELP